MALILFDCSVSKSSYNILPSLSVGICRTIVVLVPRHENGSNGEVRLGLEQALLGYNSAASRRCEFPWVRDPTCLVALQNVSIPIETIVCDCVDRRSLSSRPERG